MKSVNLTTVMLHRSTGYSYEKDWFSDLMDKVYETFEAMKDTLVRKYNGTDLVDKIVHNSNSDHDGEEGYFENSLRLPEADAKTFVAQLKSRYELNDMRYCYDSCEVGYSDGYDVVDKPILTKVPVKKAKKLTSSQLLLRKHNGNIYFDFPEAKSYRQNFVHGEARDSVLCLAGFPITKATFLKIYEGRFGSWEDSAFAVAVRNKKFVQKVRQDAELQPREYVRMDYMGIANLTALLAYMRRGYANRVKFSYDYSNHYSINLTKEEKIDLVATVLKEKKAKAKSEAKE